MLAKYERLRSVSQLRVNEHHHLSREWALRFMVSRDTLTHVVRRALSTLFASSAEAASWQRASPSRGIRAVPPYRMCGFFVLLLLTAYCAPVTAQAPPNAGDQSPRSGGHAYIQFLNETVNPATGGVAVRVDLPTAPGRGFSAPYAITYDTDKAFRAGQIDQYGSLLLKGTGATWGEMTPTVSGTWVTSYQYDDFGNQISGSDCSTLYNVSFTDIDGDSHPVNMTTSQGGDLQHCPPPPAQYSQGLSWQAALGSAGLYAVDQHGNTYLFSTAKENEGDFSFNAQQIEDPNGNLYSTQTFCLLGNPGPCVPGDTMGRPIKGYLSLTGSGSSTSTDKIFEINKQVLDGSTCNQFGLSTGINGTSSLTLPNGETYKFEYDSTYGLISKITFPGGAYVRYDWGMAALSNETYFQFYIINNGGTGDTPPATSSHICHAFYDNPAIQHRYVSYDGTTIAEQQDFTYASSVNQSGSLSGRTTTVTTHDLVSGSTSKTVYSYYTMGFLGGGDFYSVSPWVENKIEYQDGNGSLLEKHEFQWADESHKAHEIVTLANGMVSETDWAYPQADWADPGCSQEGVGQLCEVVEYGFGAGAHGPLIRKTVNTYASFAPSPLFKYSDGNSPTIQFPVLTNRVSQTTIYDGANSPVASTVYCYDQSPLIAMNGIINHDDVNYPATNLSRGNLTQKLEWVSSASSPVPLISPSNCGQAGSSTMLSSTYTYDQTGQPATATDPRGTQTTFSYRDKYRSGAPGQPTNGYLTESSTAGIKHQYSYDWATGLLATTADQNDINAGRVHKTYWYQDPLYRLTEEDGADGSVTTYGYNDASPMSITTTLSNGSASIVSMSMLDGAGHSIQERLVSDPEGETDIDTAYDGAGHVFSRTNPYRGQPDAKSIFKYDGLSRPTMTTLQDGATTTWSYAGNQVTYTDEAGNSWSRVSDVLGRLLEVTEPGNLKTDYQYDTLGNLRDVLQHGSGAEQVRHRSFTYDSVSRLITATNPETGTTCYGQWVSGSCQGGYDANGNLVAKTDANNMVLHYEFDSLNRLTHKWAADADNLDARFTYDQGNNGIGRLSSQEKDSVVGESYSYDSMGRITGTQYLGYSPRGWYSGMQLQYDIAGNPTQLTYPDGRMVKQTWSAAGRLQSVQDITPGGPQTTYFSPASGSMQYYPSGALGSVQLGSQYVEFLTLNSRLQPCKMDVYTSAFSNSKPILSRSNYYSAATSSLCGNTAGNNGNITSIVDNVAPGMTQSFTYDSLNRLSTGFRSDGIYNHTYNYDAFGNMLLHDNLHTNLNYSIDPATNRLFLNNGDFVYDAVGQLIQTPNPLGGSHAYLYTGEGYLRCIDSCNAGSYLVDAAGQRAWAWHGDHATQYAYLNGQVMTELNSDGTTYDYVYANGQKIVRVSNTDPHIHLQGTSSGPTAWTSWPLSTSPNGYPIQAGDKLVLRQWQSATARGGVNLVAQMPDGSLGFTAWNDKDQDGAYSNDDTYTGVWHNRIIPLGRLKGGTVVGIGLSGDQGSSGDWSVDLADMSLLSQDGSVHTLYNGQNLSMSPNNVVGMTNVQESTVLTAESGAAGAIHYYVADHLGSTQMELAGGGWPVWQGQFTPFGQEIIGGGTTQALGPLPPDGTPMRYKFTGKERDQESGLDYFGARYYASTMGRFTSPDWSAEPAALTYADLDDPQSLNLYGYVRNNPISRRDLDGHQEPEPPEPPGRIPTEAETREQARQAEEAAHRARQQHADEFNQRARQTGRTGPDLTPEQVSAAEGQGLANLQQALHPHGDIVDDWLNRSNPSTPIGRRGNPMNVPRGTNTPETINGRSYTGHALDQMQGRGIPFSVVEDVIQHGNPGQGNDPGTSTHTSGGVQVITNSSGGVITVKTVGR